MLRRVFAALALLASVAPSEANAQSNPGSAPLGGRSALLGGTGVALSRDGSAPFLNPATMGRIADHKVAFSVRFYRKESTRLDNFIRAPYGQTPFRNADVDRGGFGAAPSTFCAFITLAGLIPEETQGLLATVRASSGRTKLGLCGATFESEEFDFAAEGLSEARPNGRATVGYDVRRSWSRSSIGPSLSYQLTDALSLGASLHLVSTSAVLSWETTSVTLDPATEPFSAYSLNARGSANDGVAILGATLRHGIQTMGLSVRLPALAFTGSAHATRFLARPGSAAELMMATGDFVARPPPVIAFGTGAEWQRFTLEADVITTLGSDCAIETRLDTATYDSETEEPLRTEAMTVEKTRTTASLRIGTEWFFFPTLSLLAGARIDPGALVDPVDSAGIRFGRTKLQSMAASLGLGSYGQGAELLVGVEGSYSWGETISYTPGHPHSGFDHIRQRGSTVLLVLSGGVSLRKLRAAARNVEEFGRKAIPGLAKPPKQPE